MPQKINPKEMVGRIVFTITVAALFLIGSLLYVGFYSAGYTLLQKIIVVIVALVIAWAIIAISWITWAAKHGMMKPKEWQ